jgi:hypothetical protein
MRGYTGGIKGGGLVDLLADVTQSRRIVVAAGYLPT